MKKVPFLERYRHQDDLSFLDAEVVYEDEILPDHVDESYHGHEGFRKAWARAIEPWESITTRVG